MNASDAIELFGPVRRDNYLAHTIRELEHYILKNYGKHCHIVTRQSEIVGKSKCDFFDLGCVIRLPAPETIDDNEVRIRLAHELGHIIKNIEILAKDPELLPSAYDISEEIFAWEFAYRLIQLKSDTYKQRTYEAYIVDDKQLAATIQGILERSGKFEIRDALKNVLPFVK